jgi:hypothetical protein
VVLTRLSGALLPALLPQRTAGLLQLGVFDAPSAEMMARSNVSTLRPGRTLPTCPEIQTALTEWASSGRTKRNRDKEFAQVRGHFPRMRDYIHHLSFSPVPVGCR